MRLFLAIVTLAIAACSTGPEPAKPESVKPVADPVKPTTTSPPVPLRMPERHRGDTTAACTPSPPGTADKKEPGCHADTDCKDGKTGRCNRVGGGHTPPRNECSYDGCLADADCAGGGSCQCDGQGTYCLPGNCRRDADCADSHACSPTPACPNLGGGNGPSALGFYCHVRADTCVDDADCSSKGYGFRCAYSSELAHWACTNPMCPMG